MKLICIAQLKVLCYSVFDSQRKRNVLGAAHFEVCLTQDNIRYDSCLLSSYFLDKSFQMHFVGKLDFELKHNVKEKI